MIADKVENSLPYSAGAVANMILRKAKNNNRSLTHMELQKRLYLVYGLYLADENIGEELFAEPIVAWKYGPIVADVYHQFKDCNKFPIDHEYEYDGVPIIEADEKLFHVIDVVAQVYNDNDGKDLSTATHFLGSPWREVWDENQSGAAIEPELIKQYFMSNIIPHINRAREADEKAQEVFDKYGDDLFKNSTLITS